MFEPIHGSAPDIAGQDRANPGGMIASAAMMLDALGLPEEGRFLTEALDATLLAGTRTGDLGGYASCSDFGNAVLAELADALADRDRPSTQAAA